MSLRSLDICANNFTLKSFLEILFKLGEPLVLARVPLKRGLIDVIVEVFMAQTQQTVRHDSIFFYFIIFSLLKFFTNDFNIFFTY